MTAQSVRARAQKKRICFTNKPPGRSSAKNPRYDARKRPTAKGSTMVLHNHNGRRGPNAPLNLFRRGGKCTTKSIKSWQHGPILFFDLPFRFTLNHSSMFRRSLCVCVCAWGDLFSLVFAFVDLRFHLHVFIS